MKKVTVVASGYEWICPKCETLNAEIEWSENLQCSMCEEVFEADPPVHVYEI